MSERPMMNELAIELANKTLAESRRAAAEEMRERIAGIVEAMTDDKLLADAIRSTPIEE